MSSKPQVSGRSSGGAVGPAELADALQHLGPRSRSRSHGTSPAPSGSGVSSRQRSQPESQPASESGSPVLSQPGSRPLGEAGSRPLSEAGSMSLSEAGSRPPSRVASLLAVVRGGLVRSRSGGRGMSSEESQEVGLRLNRYGRNFAVSVHLSLNFYKVSDNRDQGKNGFCTALPVPGTRYNIL